MHCSVIALERGQLGATLRRAVRDLGPLVAILPNKHRAVKRESRKQRRAECLREFAMLTGKRMPSTPPNVSSLPATALGPPFGEKSTKI